METNNPQETVEDVVEQTPQGDIQQSDDDNSAGTGDKGQTEDAQAQEQTIEDFLNSDDRNNLNEFVKKHPELKPMYDHLYKSFQGGYTKKTQEIAKQRKEMNDILESWKSIQSDSELVELINRKRSGKPLIDEPITKEDKGDTADLLLKNLPENASDEEKAFAKRWCNYFKGLAKEEVAPISNTLNESTARRELEAKYGNDIEFDGEEGYWNDTKGLKIKHPSLSYEECLFLAIRTDAPEYYKNLGKTEAETIKAKNPKGGFGAGGGSRGGGSVKTGKPAEEMSAAELGKTLPRHEK